MRIAVIPARGGSKRIPRKNIRPFCGKPMISWSIEAALQSECFDQVVVSTDDPEVASIAQQCGAGVPFIRPANLADDYADTLSVVRHAIEWFVMMGKSPLQVCCIYATAPFLSANDVRRGLNVLMETNCSYAFSVTSYPFPIQRAIRINPKGRVEMFQPEQFATRSQDLEKAWHDAGQFYWGKAQAWLEQRMIFSTESVPVPLEPHRVQDIDTQEDWVRAELMFKAMQCKAVER